jgi:hypothetical protein
MSLSPAGGYKILPYGMIHFYDEEGPQRTQTRCAVSFVCYLPGLIEMLPIWYGNPLCDYWIPAYNRGDRHLCNIGVKMAQDAFRLPEKAKSVVVGSSSDNCNSEPRNNLTHNP